MKFTDAVTLVPLTLLWEYWLLQIAKNKKEQYQSNERKKKFLDWIKYLSWAYTHLKYQIIGSVVSENCYFHNSDKILKRGI